MICYSELSKAGRLGNQLWEIASTIGLAREVGEEPRFPPWDYQPFFSIPEEMFGSCEDGVEATRLVPFMDKRARAYLQAYSLFSAVEDEIRMYFKPSEFAHQILENHSQVLDLPRPIIAVHVRRGDNVTHPLGYHPLRSMQYYRDGLDYLGAGSIAIFSDDILWCRENFELETGYKPDFYYEGVARPREYVDRQEYEDADILDWIDLQLMAQCDKHIISNSTYAWWGAFLSKNRYPIYPDNWFGYHIRDWTDASLMFPESWIQLHDETQGGV